MVDVINWYGAIFGIIVAIMLILKKVNPTYSLIIGAIVGALIGGAGVQETVNVLISGTQSVMGKNRLPHRASYIVLQNSDNKFYVELRTKIKDYCPGMLAAYSWW